MALSVNMPSSPVGAGSPSSDGSIGPQTPSSPSNPPTLALPPPTDASSSTGASSNNAAAAAAANAAKRKPSRRANTAERRATHNAVERQRRETLNGRFLDLAALLPNLSQIRRPSKSSIVNSSIAHIQASRRHRIVAARELRLLKLESDALRRELNEWRDRSGLPRIEEPVRGEAFQMIMSGEVEVLSAGPIEEEDGGDYGDDQYGDDDFVAGPSMGAGNIGAGVEDVVEDIRAPMAHAAAAALLKSSSDVSPFAHSAPAGPLHLQTMIPRQGGHNAGTPMIVQSPTSVSFENPAVMSMYESHHSHSQYPGQFFGNLGNGNAAEDSKAWHGNNMFPNMSNAGPGQQQYAPSQSSQGSAQQQAAFFMSIQRQQQALLQQQQHQQRSMSDGHMYGSPADGDDASSVGSAPGTAHGGRRERSGSMASNGSGYTSPSAAGSYEMAGALPRRMGSGGNGAVGHYNEGMGMGMNGMGMGVGMMKTAPISVGGGGNGHGYASMML